MEAVFLKILELSFYGSLLILAILPVRMLLKRAPKQIVCLLWAMAAVALLCPIRLESPVSVMPTEQTFTAAIAAPTLPPVQSEPILIQDFPNTITAPAPAPTDNTRSPVKIGSLVWLCGMGIMALYALWSLMRLRKQVRVCLPMEQGIYLCDSIDTPFILGMLRPRIYLPSALDPMLYPSVLLHERAHLKRRDHWWKPLGFAILTVHWFNPLVWLGYVLLCRDIELACDEKVIRNMDILQKKDYSEALLQCSMPRHLIAACPLAFGEVGAKQRIKAVLHYKKPAFWMVMIAVAVCVGLCFGFLTDPVTRDEASIPHKELNSYLQQSSENILSAQLEENFCYGAFEAQSIIGFEDPKELCTILSALELKSKPIANDGLTRFAEKVISLTTADRGIINFCFNRIFTEFWIISSGNASAVYEVRNPAPLRELFNRFDYTNYMEHKRIEMLFQNTEYGQTIESFSVLKPHGRYYDSYYAVVVDNNEQSTAAYLVEYNIDEDGNYRLLSISTGTTDARNGSYYLNIRNGEQTILWGFVPHEQVYSDDDILIRTHDKSYTIPIYGAAFVAYLPNQAVIEEINCSNGQPVSLIGDWNTPAATPEPFTAADSATMQTLIEEHFRENNRHIANLEMHGYTHYNYRTGMTFATFNVDHLSHDGSVLAENCLYLAGFINGRLDGIASGQWAMSAGYYPNVANFNGNYVLWMTRSDTHIALNNDGTVTPNKRVPNMFTTYRITYADGSFCQWNTDGPPYFHVSDHEQKPVRIVPLDSKGNEVESFAFEGDQLTVSNVNTISEQSGWDVFLEMNAETGDINVVTSHPLYSDVPLYIDMDESFTDNEALYAALKESEHFDTWPADMKLMGRQSYGDYEYAVLQFAQMHGPTAALVEYTIDGSAVTIHSYGEGYAPDTQGFLIGYHMNMAFMEGGTMYWSLYAPRYATTKDGKNLADNNGLPPETVESKFTGFQFTTRDLKPYVFPAEESFFLCEFTTVIPPAIVTPMEGRTLLAALGSECP